MRHLELADDAGGSGEIDILISADLCWLLVDREFKKIQDSGLVTIRSKFGWLVSRPVSRVGSEVGFIKRCLSTTLCLQIFSEAECKLNEKVRKLWDLYSTEIRDDELSDFEKHASKTAFKVGKCKVDLLLK